MPARKAPSTKRGAIRCGGEGPMSTRKGQAASVTLLRREQLRSASAPTNMSEVRQKIEEAGGQGRPPLQEVRWWTVGGGPMSTRKGQAASVTLLRREQLRSASAPTNMSEVRQKIEEAGGQGRPPLQEVRWWTVGGGRTGSSAPTKVCVIGRRGGNVSSRGIRRRCRGGREWCRRAGTR